MILYRDMDQFAGDRSVVAIGTFDGLHRGHQALIRRAVERGRASGAPALALTFDRHPLTELQPCAAPPEILTREEKRERFRRLGIDGLIEQPFTESFTCLSPEEFAERLGHTLHPLVVVVGYNFHFGHRGLGDAEALRTLGGRLGFEVEVIEPVCADGEPISSTRIRALLAAGDREEAARLMELDGNNPLPT